MCLNGVALGNSHEVIGQEFEKVVVIIDENFKYKNNRLEAGNLEFWQLWRTYAVPSNHKSKR